MRILATIVLFLWITEAFTQSDLSSKFDSLMLDLGVRSASCAIIDDTRVQFLNFGKKSKDKGTTPDSSTIYEIGSITKTFTGALVQQAIREGKMELSDSLKALIFKNVEWSTELPDIIVKDLVTHSSGLPRIPGNLWMVADFNMNDPYATYDIQHLEKFIASYTGSHKKGNFSYSNLGAGIMGHVLEEIYDKPYEQLLQDVIFHPLKMPSSSGENIKEAESQNLAIPYNDQGHASFWNFDILAPAGSIKSNCTDLIHYARAHWDNSSIYYAATRVLSKADNRPIGTFWLSNSYKGETIVGHAGATGGSRSSILIIPEQRVAVILLTTGNADVERAAFSLLPTF